ncbi:MAG: TraB/GumN family protein [Bacteroidota bacterium]
MRRSIIRTLQILGVAVGLVRVAFELDLDLLVEATPAMMQAAVGGTPVAEALTAEQKAQLDAFLEAFGRPGGALDAVEPWMGALTLSSVVAQQAGATGESVDAHFFHRAKADSKPRVAFETVAQQVETLDGLTTEDQVDFLMATVHDGPDQSVAVLNDIVAAWAAGQDDRLATLLYATVEAAPVASMEAQENVLQQMVDLI